MIFLCFRSVHASPKRCELGTAIATTLRTAPHSAEGVSMGKETWVVSDQPFAFTTECNMLSL